MKKDEWKKHVFARVRKEIIPDLEWEMFSKQVDQYCYIFGGGLIKDGGVPPHGRYEIWTQAYLEHEIMNEYRMALKASKQEEADEQEETNP